MKKLKTVLKDILLVLIAVYMFTLSGLESYPFENANSVIIIYILIGLLLGAVCIISGIEAKNNGKIKRMVFYYIVAALALLSGIYQIIIEINFLFNATF